MIVTKDLEAQFTIQAGPPTLLRKNKDKKCLGFGTFVVFPWSYWMSFPISERHCI